MIEFQTYTKPALLKELRENLDGVYCLDRNTVEIEGIKFGGCDSWYDGNYLMSLFPKRGFLYYSINEMWKNCLNDYRYIFEVERYDEISGVKIYILNWRVLRYEKRQTFIS